MTQTSNRFFDEIAKLMTDAAGAAQGVRGEVENVMRSQAEKFLREMDLVQREEFDALKAMVVKMGEENKRLTAKIEKLEGQIEEMDADNQPPLKARPIRR